MTILDNKFLHGGDYNPDQWLDSPDVLEKDIELMKKAGVNCVSMAIFAWVTLEPEEGKYNFGWLQERIDSLYQNGIYTILATPSGARPVWMAHKYPEVLRVAADGVRNKMGGRHNHCYTSPVYREKVWEMNKRLAEAFAGHPGVILWHLSNEYGGECYCEQCQAAFREWLKEKYKTLENLNKAWWTAFWSHSYTSWEQVEAPAPNGENDVHGLVLDWKRFATYQTVDFCAWEKKAVEAGGSKLPVTANLMGFYEGLDYSKFRDVLDVVSWDSYPQWHGSKVSDADLGAVTACAHDLMRCIHKDKAPFLLMESTPSMTNWQPFSKLKRPGMHMLSSMQAIAHGSDSVQYFQWRKGRGSSEKLHGAVVDHAGDGENRVFRDVAELGKRLAGLEQVCGSRVKPQVALLFDQENRWAMEAARGPRNNGLNYLETVYTHYTALWRMGVMVDVIDMACQLDSYQLVVAPMLYLQEDGIAEKLRRFVENGGTLVGTYHSGIVDENDLCHLGAVPHALTDVFGLRREEIDSLYDEDSNSMQWNGKAYTLTQLCERVIPAQAEVLATYEKDFYAGEAALCKNSFGKGTAYYMAARAGLDFCEDFYAQMAPQAGVKPALDAALPAGVTAGLRIGDGKEYVFVQNYNLEKAELALNESLADAESGAAVSGKLTLEAYEVRVLVR